MLLNRDVRVRPGWLDPLITAMQDPEVLGAQSLVMGASGAVANAGFAFPSCGGVPYDFLQGFPAEDASGLEDVSMPALVAPPWLSASPTSSRSTASTRCSAVASTTSISACGCARPATAASWSPPGSG